MSITIQPITRDESAPWANWAEMNARGVLVAVELATPIGYLCDELAADDVPRALERTERALCECPGRRVRAPMSRDAEPGARFELAGSDDDAAVRRLTELAEVLAWAARAGVGVRWG